MDNGMYDKIDAMFAEYNAILKSIDYHKLYAVAKKMYESDVIVFCGNGGSYACAEHMAGDILINSAINGNTICIGDNGTSFTALANDYSYGEVFCKELTRRLRGASYEKGVLVLLSTSGKSNNIILAGTLAKSLGMFVVSIVGENSSNVAPFSDVIISMSSADAGFIEAVYGFIGHLLVRLINMEKIND